MAKKVILYFRHRFFAVFAIFAIQYSRHFRHYNENDEKFFAIFANDFHLFAIVAQMTKMAIFPSTRRWHTRVIGANRCYTRVGRSMKSKLVCRSSNELHWSSSNVVELGVGRTLVEPIFSSSNQFVSLPLFTS